MSRKVAYGGILLAINVILLMLINVIPMNTLFIMGIASLITSIVIMEWGPRSGVAFYLGSIILGFIVMSNKSQWILYTLTFGGYGLVKYIIEQNKSIYVEYILKFIFANTIIAITYFILKSFIHIPINLLLICGFQIAFFIYDYAYSSFIEYYDDKLRKMIKVK